MDESGTRFRLPWGLLLTLGAITLLLLTILRPGSESTAAAAWRVSWALAAFFVLRWQQGYVWGLLAALLPPLHPLYVQWTTQLPQAVRAEALALLMLAGVTLAGRLTFRATFAWKWWLPTAALLTVGGALAWLAWPSTGLAAGLLTLLALPGTAFLAWRQVPRRAALGNVAAALGLGLAAPVAALFLAPVLAPLTSAAPLHWSPAADANQEAAGAQQLLAQAVQPDGSGSDLRCFRSEELDQWARPIWWLVLPLMAWGLWCAFSRGWKEWRRREPPLAWGLLLFALVTLALGVLHPQRTALLLFLPLASLAVLLAVFGVADLLRGITDGLTLLPPGERES